MTFSPLKPNDVLGSQYARFEWSCLRLPNDTLLEDILKPGWWIHLAPTLKPMERVELVTLDGLLDTEFRVLRIADGLVYVRPLRIYEDKAGRALSTSAREKQAEATAIDLAADHPMPDGYKRGHSPVNGYFVVLKASGKTLKTGLPTKAEAVTWATEHAKKAGLLEAA